MRDLTPIYRYAFAMRRYLVLVLILGAAFFGVGIGWGVWMKDKQAQQLAHSVPLRVLCAEKWLSNESLEKFSHRHNVRIQQWTYASPAEFLRQMANADGNVDVICASSFLVKSLVKSGWLKKMNFQDLPNAKLLGVDFSHLPFDREGEYTVPVYWNLFGFFGKGEPRTATWKQISQDKKMALWGEELNVLEFTGRLGLDVEKRLSEEEDSKAGKALDEELKRFVKSSVHFIKPAKDVDPASLLDHYEWVEMPLGRVAGLLAKDQSYGFWLPQDGAPVEMGVFAVGEKAAQPELAMKLINQLISSEEALGLHRRLNTGVVQSSLNSEDSVAPLERSDALRQFPLNRLQFPELNLEALPRFQKIYDQMVAN
jgi:spermidine/putrescine-binding protein